jgi:hypothetical protein
MKSDVFIARLARGAAATAMAGTWMLPQNETAALPSPVAAQEAAYADLAAPPEATTRAGAEEAVVLTMSVAPSEWDKKMEREFRRLALEEARGNISQAQAKRLEELNRWRDQLLHAQTAEEILVQLKRDRLLARMEGLLKEYVEFQEAAGHKRAAA